MTGTISTHQPRMANPGTIIPEATTAVLNLYQASHAGGVPDTTLELVHLRASQINGCGFCVDSGAKTARKAGETDERLFAVAAWRDTPYFTLLMICTTNVFNRLNVSTRQLAGSGW